MKKIYIKLMLLLMSANVALGNVFTKYNNDAKLDTRETIKSSVWIFSILAAMAAVYPVKFWLEYLNKKYEDSNTGQPEIPKATKWLGTIGVYLLSTFSIYLTLGVLGGIWAGQSFSDMWSTFIQEPIAYLLGF